MSNVEFKIERQLGVIAAKSKGWNKELNLVSWNGRQAKYDIREWDPDHESMGKGVTLSNEELRNLYDILKNIFEEDVPVSHDEIKHSGGSLTAFDIVNHAK